MKISFGNDNILSVSCKDDNTWKIYCDICDTYAIDVCCKNYLKSQTHMNKFKKGQQRKKNKNE